MKQRVVILGAGFGGLELATRLSEEASDMVEVVLIDQSDHFVFGFSKLDVMFGRSSLAAERMAYSGLDKPGVRFIRDRITQIDPATRIVTTDSGSIPADILVVALGADLDPGATPGLVEEGTEFYSLEGAQRMASTLGAFEGGDAVVAVLGPFFKCPAAPFEAALMLDDFLRAHTRRDRSTIKVVSPMPAPIPISPEASAGILSALEAKDIEWWPQSLIRSLDVGSKVADLADGRTTAYDLVLGVPVHRAPLVVETSGLATDGWIAVDPATFATAYPDVYAIGDVTSAPVPRVGVMAEGEARTVADVLIHRLAGGDEAPPFRGEVTCFIEMGAERIARFDANFLGGAQPVGTFTPPSEATAASKHEFGASRRARWFGASV